MMVHQQGDMEPHVDTNAPREIELKLTIDPQAETDLDLAGLDLLIDRVPDRSIGHHRILCIEPGKVEVALGRLVIVAVVAVRLQHRQDRFPK